MDFALTMNSHKESKSAMRRLVNTADAGSFGGPTHTLKFASAPTESKTANLVRVDAVHSPFAYKHAVYLASGVSLERQDIRLNGMSDDYQLVQLANGTQTLFSASYGEKMHPGLGPSAEAELLYVRQLNICERLKQHAGEFVVWDIGLGAAANAIAALKATQNIAGVLRLVSFDNTREPLEFALNNAQALDYVVGYETALAALLREGRAEFQNGQLQVRWEFHLADFPKWLERRAPARLDPVPFQRAEQELGVPAPHAIFFDAFSPAKNPAMWTLPVFEHLFRALDPAWPCALTTYSRSTLSVASTSISDTS